MSLTNEAAYLYVYAKKLERLHRLLQELSKDAERHLHKHQMAESERKREKHRKKHHKTMEEIKELMNEHNKLLERLKHHQVAFAHQLQKKHKI